MLMKLLRAVDLKELRNTQDFLDKRTTNNLKNKYPASFLVPDVPHLNTHKEAKVKPRSEARPPLIIRNHLAVEQR
jgi:hypothetical protein